LKTKEEGLKVLEGLKVDMGNKSGTMLMRTLYDQIEASLASGVTREIILKKLNETYDRRITLQSFDKNLYRIRKERKQKGVNTDLISDNIINQVYPYVNNGNNDKSIISDQAYLMDKENTNDRVDIKEDNSKKYHTPNDIRKIREKTLKELDDDLNGNYD
jgi:Glu-tRNA(Gln) amidotransferase subunit E-like FAD-binding protein